MRRPSIFETLRLRRRVAGDPGRSIWKLKLQDFFDYFVTNWLENINIPVAMWSCHGKKHRTTNAVEGWHNKINSSIGNPNPRISSLIKCMRKEAENSEHMAMRQELLLCEKKRTTYVKLDSRIKNIAAKYQETKDIRACLKAISHMQSLDWTAKSEQMQHPEDVNVSNWCCFPKLYST